MDRYRRIGFIGVFASVGIIASAYGQQSGTISRVAPDAKPTVSDLPISGDTVTDLHLRPLFTTTIRLPEAVTSVAVGAPTLFEVEHSDQEPRLVFVKPSTKEPAISNLVIALESGQEISARLISDGSDGNAPVDFVINYRPQQSFLIGSTDSVAGHPEAEREQALQSISMIDQALQRQTKIATPDWVGGLNKDAKNPDQKAAANPLMGALGEVIEKGDEMLVAYSVLNTTDHWIEVLPPQVELNSLNLETTKKNDKKKKEILAEQVPISDFRLTARRLAPGERADGAVQFSRPGFKQSKDRLLLQLATASAVDTPFMLPLPFVAPGQ